MASTLEVLHTEALKLSASDRAWLIDRLIASLDVDPEVQEAWAAEVALRLAAVDDGSASWLPGPETLEKLKAEPDWR